MTKDIFEEERKMYNITKINSHHGHRAVIIERKNLGTKSKTRKKTMLSDTQNGGSLRRK